MNDKILSRIAALLTKAERTDNEHEAQAFMDKAQKLVTLNQIDMEHVRLHAARGEVREVPTVRVVRIGKPGTMGLGNYAELFMAIGRANNLKHDIARNSSQVWAYGFASDIDTTQALYASLVIQMSRATDAYLRKGDYKSETYWRYKKVTTTEPNWAGRMTQHTENVYGNWPVSGRTAKVAFQEAFASQVGRRLSRAREAVATSAPGGSAELVLVGRQDAVEVYHSRVSDAKGRYKGSSHSGSAHATIAGLEAGSRARLGTEHAIGGSRKAVSA